MLPTNTPTMKPKKKISHSKESTLSSDSAIELLQSAADGVGDLGDVVSVAFNSAKHLQCNAVKGLRFRPTSSTEFSND